MQNEAKDWVERDTASVWHGFTQMAAYSQNSPVIAVIGRGSRDHRCGRPSVPGRDLLAVGDDARSQGARTGPCPHRPDGPGRTHHAAGKRERRGDRARRGVERPPADDRPETALRLRRRGCGGAGDQDRLPVLGQPRCEREDPVPRTGWRLPRRHARLDVRRRRRLRHRPVRSSDLRRAAGSRLRPGGRGRGGDRDDRAPRRRVGRRGDRTARAGRQRDPHHAAPTRSHRWRRPAVATTSFWCATRWRSGSAGRAPSSPRSCAASRPT